MSTTIEIDDVHEFMLDKMVDDEGDYGDVIHTLIYQTYQMQEEQGPGGE